MVKSPAMSSRSAPLTPSNWTRLILGMTLLFSLIVRVFPGLLVGFPLNDGGMFLVMMRDLRSHGFSLPALTTYNLAEIPYAYPPLGFYVGALLSGLGLPELGVLRWLPVVISLACIPAFYLLARALLKDGPRAAVATLVYALVPGNYAWMIMGGGLTRSFGVLFILLATYSVYRMFRRGTWKLVGASALFCSLAVLSHPEVILATTAGCALFWLFFGRSRRGTWQASLVAAGTLLLTAPWWGSIVAAHGLLPFQAVLHSGGYGPNPLRALALDLFDLSVFGFLFKLLFAIGIAWNLYRRQFLLPLWLVLPYFVEPRSAPAFGYYPECIMAAQALTEALPAALDRWRSRGEQAGAAVELTQRQGHSLALFGLMFLWFVQGAFYGFVLANTSLRPPLPQETMLWVEQHTAPGSEFLIMTGNSGIMTDPMQEWFPALAGRNSRTTLQGMEWTLGETFFPRLGQLAALQGCQEIQCVENWSDKTGLSYTHLLVERNDGTAPLLQSLSTDPGYRLLYENKSYLVFERLLHHPEHPWEPVPQNVCCGLSMYGRRLVLQGSRWIIAPADESADPRPGIYCRQERLI